VSKSGLMTGAIEHLDNTTVSNCDFENLLNLNLKRPKNIFLNRGPKSMTRKKLKLLVNKTNEIKQIWTKKFIHCCLLYMITNILRLSIYTSMNTFS